MSLEGSKEQEKAFVDLSFRTSRNSDLGRLQNPTVQALDQKICQVHRVGPARLEGTHLKHYAVGAEFKAQTDYFEPQTDEYHAFAAHQGNTTWTFMVYLNEDEGGGETEFLQIQRIINPHTIHAGRAVNKGEKFLMTKWFRER